VSPATTDSPTTSPTWAREASLGPSALVLRTRRAHRVAPTGRVVLFVVLAKGRLIPPDPPLSDGEVVLRMRRAADVPLIAEASNDAETQRRMDDEPLTLTTGRERDSVARAEEQWRRGCGAPFVIADAADDRPLGLLNLQFGEDEEVAGFAISVFPQARGRGVASKALRLAATWALRELGLRRVFAEAAADNHASIRVIEKAGFQREGVLRAHCKTHGRRHDCVMFSLLPQDIDHDR
jgi:RimJ/RimL family protein N-acetyltransferase